MSKILSCLEELHEGWRCGAVKDKPGGDPLSSRGASALAENPHPSMFPARTGNHLNLGLENQETSSKCFHLSRCFLLNFIKADNLYIHLQGNVI